MTTVMLLGEFPATGLLGATTATRAPAAAGSGPAADFIETVASALGRRGAVVVVRPAWPDGSGDRLVRLARAALLTDRIADLPLDLPPLALSLVADQLAFLAPYTRPGLLAGAAHRLAATVVPGAWLSSVAGLGHIHTGLSAHLASYLPGTGFSVLAGRQAGVHRVTSAAPVQRIEHRPRDPVLVLSGAANGDTAWVREHLGPALGAARITDVDPAPGGAAYWGTKKFAEFVAFSGHPDDMTLILRDLPDGTCRWCGEALTLPACPFCEMDARHAVATVATPPSPAPEPPSASDPPAAPPRRPSAQEEMETAVTVRDGGARRRSPDGPPPARDPDPRPAADGDEAGRTGTVAFGPVRGT
ncbi:hypothetical protein [Actinomadura flavalba]|uniref:hypothetical protein n=1 Tax=Actinomadura flavalba TaxID=1120938 RepID=UPI00036D6466|nr:hypothetical protein [Actinomadura flavalba]